MPALEFRRCRCDRRRVRASRLLVMLMSGWALVACDSGRPDVRSPTAGATTTAALASAPADGSCRTTPGSSRADFNGREGEFMVLLYDVDVRGRSLTFDVIQYLVGEDAVREHRRLNPQDPFGPPNDYMTVNALERIDRAMVTANPRVRVLGPDHVTLVASTFEQLPPPERVGRRPGLGLHTLTFREGLVTDICQVFTP
jgi:hypothetical protein